MDDAPVVDARVTALWTLAARRLLSGYRHFLPTIVLTWLVAGVAAERAATMPWLAQAGLGIVCFFFLTASAARAAGATSRAPIELAISRAGACVGPLVVAMALLAIAVVALGAGAQAGGERGAMAGIAAAGLVTLAVLARAWPAFSLPYFAEAPIRWSSAARASVWTGPGLGRAVAITRSGARPETLSMVTAVVLIAAMMWLGRSWLHPLAWDAVLFLAVLPYLAMLNLLATARVLARAGARP